MTDSWSNAEHQQGSAPPSRHGERALKGRVLRVKHGYNPNSSSIGSTIPGYLAFAVASGALTVMLMNVLDLAGRLLRQQKDDSGPPTPPSSSRNHGDDRTEVEDP